MNLNHRELGDIKSAAPPFLEHIDDNCISPATGQL